MATKDDKLLAKVKKGLAACDERESSFRTLFVEDLKFANADPDNGWQWETKLRSARQSDPNGARPALTINKTKQHNRQITNDARQNKPTVRVYPVDNGADRKTADILNGIIRHIESNSSADVAYDMATEFAVDAGLGYWRVTTDYASDDSFDQEIFIKSVKSPLNIYLGEHQEPDGSDACEGFVFEDLKKELFERKYPDAEAISWDYITSGDNWLTKDHIRVCEYFEVVYEKDTLFVDDSGTPRLWSSLQPEELAQYQMRADLRKRTVSKRKVKWHLLAGDGQVLDQRDWPGRYIPIVRVVGEELEIDGKVERKGHTRALKDAQRMYNYWSSAGVEYGALQGKQPYLAPAEAIEGYEEYWNTLNKANHPYLPYNSYTEDGQQIPMPQRQAPPVAAPMYMSGMQTASDEMKMASGQYDASLGARSNETSGRAITARQREGDTATFHFIDNVARAIKYTGKILVDLIPKIYDTERVIRILGEDGKEDMVKIDPSQKEAYLKRQNEMTQEIEEIYNPSIGRYDVTVAVGPSYSTRRQEAFYALTDMASRNPQVMQVAGDLVMKAADFPMAEELAERFEKTLPPGLQGDEDQSPEVMQLKQQVQQLGQALQNASAAVDEAESKKEIDSRKLDIEAYKAETERMQALAPAITPEAVQALVVQAVRQILSSPPLDEPPERTGIEQPPPMKQPMQQPTEPPQGGFFTPEQTQ